MRLAVVLLSVLLVGPSAGHGRTAPPTPDDYAGLVRYYRCAQYQHGKVRGWLVQTKFTEPNGGGGGPELWEHVRAVGPRPYFAVADCSR